MLIKAMKLYFLGLSLCLGMLCTFVAQSTMAAQAPLKLSELLQQPVFTDGGQELGKVVDVALDEQAQQINFVVISVASFLVEENLIAVHPDALIYRRSSDAASADASASSSASSLVSSKMAPSKIEIILRASNLATARRFAQSNWPAAADVLPAQNVATVEEKNTGSAQLSSQGRKLSMQDLATQDSADDSEVDSGDDSVESAQSTLATISDGKRTASLKSGAKRPTIENTSPDTAVPSQKKAQQANLKPKLWRGEGAPLYVNSEFDELDEDGNGYLSRRELGGHLAPGIEYGKFDLDDNQGIDTFEYQLLKGED